MALLIETAVTIQLSIISIHLIQIAAAKTTLLSQSKLLLLSSQVSFQLIGFHSIKRVWFKSITVQLALTTMALFD